MKYPVILIFVALIAGLVIGTGVGATVSRQTITVTNTAYSTVTTSIIETVTETRTQATTLKITETATIPVTTTTTAFSTITESTTMTATITLTVTVEAPVKAEWTSGDGRLKISSEAIPYMIGREIASYTVRVTVTNVSDKPISKVLIIIFPYIGDRLYEYWNWASHSAEITSLMPGESITHEFLLLPKDMTSYKITAFAL